MNWAGRQTQCSWGLNIDQLPEIRTREIGFGPRRLASRSKAFAAKSLTYRWATSGQLAQSEAQLGDYKRRRHFVEAWEIQPNSVPIAQGYASLLVRLGKKDVATEVLQSASRFAPNNVALREQWMNLALESGDLSRLLQVRLSRYSLDPSDIRNVVELAFQLGVTEPTVETIRLLNPEFPYDSIRFSNSGRASGSAG